ncbi:SusE domain-containing protein [Sphingobacterium sp. DN00404]|uniref:SusE domain-containing protein n=1 Tax=Sphingobacterium micropteri TaxID=2763501 RepID=A0ABR7YKM0_9SPHI|nr:SusE domain-containing protein [Sphingobacterium micropteri]MBD1431857.1 SusE domain-containing protein [Sphingobacterium micropteri]
MKNLTFLIIAGTLFLLGACKKEYLLSTDFTVPAELVSPAKIALDVTSTDNIVLSWNGGGANDGAYVLYEVVFVKKGGDLSDPVERIKSDFGAHPRLTLTHAVLNTIARKAGIAPGETGEISWSVLTSKGGDVRSTEQKNDIEVTRGEGIDNMPDNLYLYGEGNESNGAQGSLFRKAADGIYIIYSKVAGNGELAIKGTVGEEEFGYYLDGTKLKEGEGVLTLTPNANPYRITVNFNTLSIKTEVVSNVRCIWGASFDVIGQLSYVGDGKFVAANSVIRFLDPSKPETNPPAWLGWIEERYYFIAVVDGVEKCWGRMDGVSSERPTGGEPLSFYEIGEFTWSQWEHLWKMKGDLDSKRATITINTNKENLMVHEFSNITNL